MADLEEIKRRNEVATEQGKREFDKRKMDDYRAVALAEGFEEGTREEVRAAWQHLVDTGLAWRLQGWFGRTAVTLIKAGEVNPPRDRSSDELQRME